MNFSLGNNRYFFLLSFILLLIFLIFNFFKKRRKKREKFSDYSFHDNIFNKSYKHNFLLITFYLFAVLFLIFSFVDLTSEKKGSKISKKISDFVFLLDISDSMNSEDVEPSRLIRAKETIARTLQKMKSDRVCLIVFAGEALSIVPPTRDYSFVETYLEEIETKLIRKQGTNFLKAIEKAFVLLKKRPENSRNVILISDGEDNENNMNLIEDFVKKNNIKVIGVGIGTDLGAPIPEYTLGELTGYKTDKSGRMVISRRQTKTLKKLSRATGGEYINGNNENAFEKLFSTIERFKKNTEIKINSESTIHYYQWFLVISILLFFTVYFINPKKDLNF